MNIYICIIEIEALLEQLQKYMILHCTIVLWSGLGPTGKKAGAQPQKVCLEHIVTLRLIFSYCVIKKGNCLLYLSISAKHIIGFPKHAEKYP